mgnify:CR=1 FL=1
MKTSGSSQELIVAKTVRIRATPSQVWEALTNPQLTKKYFFGCEVHSTWQVGEPIVWTGRYNGKDVLVKGHVKEIVPGERLKYTAWSGLSGLEDIPSNYTVVTIELTGNEQETVMHVTDGNFGDGPGAEQRYQASVKGWDMVLKGLKDLVER